MVQRTNAWVGTEYTYEDAEEYLRTISEHRFVRGVVGQEERCPDTGRNHIQFYVELHGSQRRSFVRSNISETAHWEERKGSKEQAYDYCTKTESRVTGPWSFGTWNLRPGQRTDLEAVQAALDAGWDQASISQSFFTPWVRYNKAFALYAMLHQPARNWVMDVQVLWGDPGVGKTRRVYEEAASRNERVYSLLQNDNGVPWFDGYSGEEVLLIDDYYGWIKLSYLLKLLDRYPLKVQVKGGVINFTSKRIYITSNKPIAEWYDWDKFGNNLRKALQRRITMTTYLWNPNAENE